MGTGTPGEALRQKWLQGRAAGQGPFFNLWKSLTGVQNHEMALTGLELCHFFTLTGSTFCHFSTFVQKIREIFSILTLTGSIHSINCVMTSLQ